MKSLADISVTSRKRPKSALYLMLKIVKGPFGLCETLFAKYAKKLKERPFGGFKKFPKKFKLTFLNSVTVPKNVEGGPFGIYLHPLCFKISKQMKGRPFDAIQNFQTKRLIVPKKSK